MKSIYSLIIFLLSYCLSFGQESQSISVYNIDAIISFPKGLYAKADCFIYNMQGTTLSFKAWLCWREDQNTIRKHVGTPIDRVYEIGYQSMELNNIQWFFSSRDFPFDNEKWITIEVFNSKGELLKEVKGKTFKCYQEDYPSNSQYLPSQSNDNNQERLPNISTVFYSQHGLWAYKLYPNGRIERHAFQIYHGRIKDGSEFYQEGNYTLYYYSERRMTVKIRWDNGATASGYISTEANGNSAIHLYQQVFYAR